ncbi:hypothetical protein P3S67_022276 [Capsicum chacoense]
MVTVSQQQKNIKKIQDEISEGVGLTLKGDDLLQRGDRLRSRLKQKGSSVLVILDDVWEVVDLKRLGIPSGSDHSYQCKVALTTRDQNVCVIMEKAGNSADDPSLTEVAKEVAKECKGLPLAVVTVAGALKPKTKPSWDDALVELRKAAPKNIPRVLEEVYQPLKLSYNHLESDEARYVFLLCSLFEEDSDIWTEELLKYGMGLGIFSELENLERARNRVSNLLETLKNCFLLSKGSDKKYVKMHDNNIPFSKLEMLEVLACHRLRHLFSVSLACPDDEEEGISRRTHTRRGVIKFPNLYCLELRGLQCFTHFCSDAVEGIEFPVLRAMHFLGLREFQNFWPRANDAITDSTPLFNEKVSCPNLEVLQIDGANNNITALCSHQLPTAYFSKLKTLKVWGSGKLRNLMSPSVARGLLNLRTLSIKECQSMEEVITEEERQGEEIMTNEPLIPLLKKLLLDDLPKLGHFILTKQALEFPFLKEVEIFNCPEMKTFVQQGSVSTPSLKIVNDDDVVKVDDLNEWIHQRFISKEDDGCESEVTIE